MTSVLIAQFEGRAALAPLVRAALNGEIAYVALTEAPPAGRNVLQLFVAGELSGAVGAELVGSGRNGEYPLRLRLLDEAHALELQRLASGEPSLLPRPVSCDEDRTLQSSGAAHIDRTLPSGRLASSVAAAGQLDELVVRGTVAVRDAEADEPTLQRAPTYFDDEESQTLTGSTRSPGVATNVSWNVRIAPTTKDPLCGRTIGGKYVLDSVIGTGAIGIVFKASHRDLGRTVAIKVLNPRYQGDADLLTVFRTEARAASQLEHPHVARVYDFGQEADGLVYIVMEYLSGYTLGSVLTARRKLTSTRALDLMMQVCAGLSAAHERGIVHRDVKPDNIVLVPAQDDEGHPVEIVKVCDFGIAALATTCDEQGLVAGTPQYMAPEQTTGLAPKPSADVYGCGVVLYEMLAGEVPFTDPQAYRILMKHRSDVPRAPTLLEPTISSELELVVLKCLEKAPERRYQSARELRVELRKLAETKA